MADMATSRSSQDILDDIDAMLAFLEHVNQAPWEILYIPCPTCAWPFYDQTRLQYKRDEVECQVCRTVVPMSVLYHAEEDRVLGLIGGPRG